MANQRFPRELRLCRGAEFERVYQRRCMASDDWLLVFGQENGLPHSRLGLSVGRKVGSSVVRNRWKRLIREAFRLDRDELPPGMDWIVLPRSANQPELAELRRSLARLAARVVQRLRKQQP